MNSMANQTQNIPYHCDQFFSNILEEWLEMNRIHLKGATLQKYHNLIETQIKPCIGDKKLSELTELEINKFLLSKMENGRLDGTGGLAPSYIRSILLVVNSVLNYATEKEIRPPMRMKILKPQVEKRPPVILSLEEQKRLEKAVQSTFSGGNAAILLALKTGMRIGEICALSWEDVDFDAAFIRVCHTIARVRTDKNDDSVKTKLIIDSPKTQSSRREIPLTSSLKNYLLELKKHSSSPYVISSDENFISPRTLEYRYHRILKENGITSVNFHALRHTFATRCIESDVDVKSLSEILGHANVNITLNTYVHSSMDLKRKQLEKLSALLG